MNDLTEKLIGTSMTIRCAAVHWWPIPGFAEKIPAVIIVVPEINENISIGPAAFIPFNIETLKEILGESGGEAAKRVFNSVAEYINRQLMISVPIEDLKVQFQGFSIGELKEIVVFSEDQILPAAAGMFMPRMEIDY